MYFTDGFPGRKSLEIVKSHIDSVTYVVMMKDAKMAVNVAIDMHASQTQVKNDILETLKRHITIKRFKEHSQKPFINYTPTLDYTFVF